MKKAILLAFAFCVTTTFAATEVMWIKLESRFNYKDLDYSCDYMGITPNIYLVAEIDGSKIINAKLRLSKDNATVNNSIALTDVEMDGVTLYKDAKQVLWLSKLPLSIRSLNWIFFAGKNDFMGCAPKEGLKTLDPASFVFNFDTSLLEKDQPAWELHSQTAVFKGLTVKGKPFRIDLRLDQRNNR